jgi:hypothetical protein
MMSRSYLDNLKQKPMPNKKYKKGVTVYFDNVSAKPPEGDAIDTDAIDTEAKQIEQSTTPETEEIVPIIFQDRRTDSKVDRATVIDELKKRKIFGVHRARQQSILEEEYQDELVESVEPPLDEVVKSLETDVVLQDPIRETTKPDSDAAPKKRGRKSKKEKETDAETETDQVVLEGTEFEKRMPQSAKEHLIKGSPYYMNNRKLFINKLIPMFAQYKKELADTSKDTSCEAASGSKTAEFKLMVHQKVVTDYLNLYTPYRGLLLYHGLGSGKTCTSISIAEGMKTKKHIYVLTLAALKANFFEQMKVCGDLIYKLNQYWEFVSTEGQPDYVGLLSKALSISTATVRKNRGAWMVNVQKASNFHELEDLDKKAVNAQLDEMIRSKYTDLNYNGMTKTIMDNLTANSTKNPFDNSVVIIDEAHNFVSRIVNKIKDKGAIMYKLYELLMSATNARIVLLSGTPIINYPNEIGIMFNILRGYIKTWTFPVKLGEGADKPSRDNILKWLKQDGLNRYDYVEFSGDKLTITRNPFGFVNTFQTTEDTRRKLKGGSASKKKRPNKKARKSAKQSKKGLFEVKNGLLILRDPLDGSRMDETDSERQERVDAGFEVQRGGAQNGGGLFEDYSGVELDETGNMSDADFKKAVLRMLAKRNIPSETAKVKMIPNLALPAVSKEFMEMFVELGAKSMKNKDVFQRRILGLTSYFKGADDSLYPSFVPSDHDTVYHIERVPMSEYQFGLYEKIRNEESKREKQNARSQAKRAKQGVEDLFKIASTYRIASRMCCNFAFPDPPGRPQKREGEKGGEEDLGITDNSGEMEEEEAVKTKRATNTTVGGAVADEEDEDDDDDDKIGTIQLPDNDSDEIILEDVQDLTNIEIPEQTEDTVDYAKRMQRALIDLKSRSDEIFQSSGLQMYSPKFLKLLDNLQNKDNEGLHLIYSQFRSMEGIGILKLVLEANGFAELKLRRVGKDWELDDTDDDAGKPKFALHTGTESDEEKKIILNIYNSKWGEVPSKIVAKFQERGQINNFMGEVVRVLMITASGAEGINLKNTRFVHVVEPYWHMVRLEQVIGRARRICSHQDLPPELRTVQVFLYIATLTEQQSKDEKHIELRLRDISKLTSKLSKEMDESSRLGRYVRHLTESPGVVTTDQQLFENALRKDYVNSQILDAVKETAMDCRLYGKQTKDENLVCYSFGQVQSNSFASLPTISQDLAESSVAETRETYTKFIGLTYNTKKYMKSMKTGELYELAKYKDAKENGTELGEADGRVYKERGTEKIEIF